MKCPITYTEKSVKRIINPNAKFILIGNNIDGFVSFDFKEFKNFDEVKENLFDILHNIYCVGEWNISLYQVEEGYKIRKKYGYYKIPNRGKMIYCYSYMDSRVSQINFSQDNMVIFNTFMDYWENWHAEEIDFHNYALDIHVLKIKIK